MNRCLSKRTGLGAEFILVGLEIFAICCTAHAADREGTPKPAAVEAERVADFMACKVLDVQDLAEGAEIQRRFFNRITPPGVSLIQPMSPAVAPFDAANFDESFLGDLLGEDKNSVSVYPLSLALDPKTRETLVYNAEGSLMAVLPADGKNRIWPKGADPSRVHLRMDLLPIEDVEPYLYSETRVEDALAAQMIAKSKKLGGTASKGLGTGEFGICGIRKTTNGTMLVSVTNGADIAEVYAYTVAHTSSVAVATWTNEYDEVITDTNVLWHPVSPPFNGKKGTWTNQTTNLALTGGAGVWEDVNISSNDRVRFYAAAKRSDADADGLSDGMEAYVFHTNPDNYDSDGDFLPDAWEAGWGLSPCVSNSPTSDWDGDGLCDRDEYRYCTDPTSVDTDGDGINDGAEVSQQPPTNPSTPDEVYDPTNCSTFNLTVGDPSGSASERWEFVFREADSGRVVIRHMDGGFGVPATKTYTLNRGHYKGTVQWIASNRSPPDYDWRAWINNSKSSGPYDGLVNTACFLVADPDSLLTTETQGNSRNLAEGREVDLLIPYSCDCNIDIEQETIQVGRSSGSATLNVTSNSQAQGDFIWTSEPTGIYGTGRSIAFCPSNLLHDEYMVTCYSSADVDCFDVCFVHVLKVDMTRPDEKATTRYYHYDYDDSTPGVCDISCNVDISPNTSEITNKLQGGVNWSIDDISGSTLSWQNGSSGVGLAVYEPAYNDWREKAIYTGLPSDNDEFGEKNVTVTIDSLGCSQSGKTKVFFGRDDKNHPGPDSGSTPNWFYFWSQGAVGGGLSDFEYGGDSLDINGKYISSTDALYIYGGAVVPQVAQNVTHKTNSMLQFTIGVSASGIDFVAAVVLHEKKHKWIYHNWAALPDTDGDGVPDSEEICAPYYFDKNDADSYNLGQVIHSSYYSYGDQEFLCRMAEQGYVSDPTKDWANPGKQWTYGITEY